MMVKKIQAIINVLVNNGANQECGITWNKVRAIKSKLGISESKNVFLRSALPLCPNPFPIS
jgi:hypothetical protein